MREEYIEKIYAGYLGKNIGVRLGAPVEPLSWTYDRIRKIYPAIQDYLKPVDRFASDDDINGPSFFFRALIDEKGAKLTPEAVGKAWLNYTRENLGMFWWGGEGISTEHTAYLNLKKGISAPNSGSIKQNGLAAAEQIGGQIFIDTWGLLFPDNPEKAAEYAGIAASVSHDGNGIFGARFLAACIAIAFEEKNVQTIISKALEFIPQNSLYAQVVQAVLTFKHDYPTADFKDCRQYLEEEWGYNRYPGACHIIPNAGICVLALIYGAGEFAKTIEIATMCGWDTDCNAGNVATILGVKNGIQGIPEHYRKPINDITLASSASGYLNIIDIPTFVKELVRLSDSLKTEPQFKESLIKNGELNFDFSLPFSTHGFRTNAPHKLSLTHRTGEGKEGNALEILFDNIISEDFCKVYYKTFYHRHDLEDERYSPVFTPLAHSKQTVSAILKLEKWEGNNIFIVPFIQSQSGEILLNPIEVEDQWQEINFEIPPTKDALIEELGFYIRTDSVFVDGNGALGRVLLDHFIVKGASWYTLDFQYQQSEFNSITPFSHHLGEQRLEDDKLILASQEEASYSLTGNYYTKNLHMTGSFTPLSGENHQIVFRASGIFRSYSVGFVKNGVALYRHDFGTKELVKIAYCWQHSQTYPFDLSVNENRLSFKINGKTVLTSEELVNGYGMYGFVVENSKMEIGTLMIKSSI